LAASALAAVVLITVGRSFSGGRRDEGGERLQVGVVEQMAVAGHERRRVAVGGVLARLGDALEVVVAVPIERVKTGPELAAGADRRERVTAIAALVGEERAPAAHLGSSGRDVLASRGDLRLGGRPLALGR
jgi:hypothetical protein